MICACQTRATDIKLMETTQSIRTRTTLDSWRVQSRPRSYALRCFHELDVRCPGLAGADHCQSARSYSMAPKLQVRRLTPPSRSTRPSSQDLHAISKELPCLILLAS